MVGINTINWWLISRITKYCSRNTDGHSAISYNTCIDQQHSTIQVYNNFKKKKNYTECSYIRQYRIHNTTFVKVNCIDGHV